MDTRRAILWMIFFFSLLFLWNNWQIHTGKPSFFGAPTQQSQSAQPGNENGGEIADASVPAGIPVDSAAAPSAVPAGPVVAETAEPVVVTTDVLRLTFDQLGARIVKAELLAFPEKSGSDQPVVLLDDVPGQLVYTAESGVVGPQGAAFPTHRTPFKVTTSERELNGDSLSISFESTSGGLQVVKTYTLYRGRYDIEVTHSIHNVGDAPVTPSVYYQLTRDDTEPGGSTFYSTFTGPAVYTQEEKFQKVDFSDIEKQKATYATRANNGWVAMIQHYFVTAWVPQEGAPRAYDMAALGNGLYAVRAIEPIGTLAPGEAKVVPAQLWVGPQDQDALGAVAPGLDLVVDYGWLTIIAKPLFILMTWLHSLLGNWGWTIVALTVIIKLVFFPLSAASYRSMARMKQVAPRLTALREKYGDDKQKLNAAMMELYRNEKINPLGGCLPIAVQIPVFIALYWVLLASVEMRDAPWILWIHDLSARDPLFILPAIMMATMFLQIKLNPTPPDPMQARVMMLMPLIFGGMMFFFPSGLVLYWVVNNILSIAQQWAITRKFSHAPAGAQK